MLLLAMLTACQSIEKPTAEVNDILLLDAEELDVCDFKFNKHVWMRRQQDMLAVGGTSLWTATTDVVMPVNITFVGKVDMAAGIKLTHHDGNCTATATTMVRLTSAVPDYDEMQRLTRTDWYSTSDVDDAIVTRLVDTAIDTVLTRNRVRMLEVTDQHARNLLMPLLQTQLQLEQDKLTLNFEHK